MRWKKGRRSTNVEDRRGSPVKAGASTGGGAIILALIAVFVLGQDPAEVLQQVGGMQQQSAPPAQRSAAENEAADFESVVLADTEDTWNGLFRWPILNTACPTLSCIPARCSQPVAWGLRQQARSTVRETASCILT